MSKLFLTNIDLNTNELQNAVVQNLSSAPLSGNKEGRIYYDVTNKALYLYTDGQWKPLASGGSATSSLELTGDVTGSANVDPATGKITLDTTIVNNSITLGDDTVGDYVAGINGTTNEIDVSNSGGEGSTPTISLPNTIYKPTTFSIGYQEGFDITFSDNTGDTYLNQTNGDGTVHVLGDLRVDYATSANNPEYTAFQVNPSGAITTVRNQLTVTNDNSYQTFQFNGNGAYFNFNHPDTGNTVFRLDSNGSAVSLHAGTGDLNLISENNNIYISPNSNNSGVGGNLYVNADNVFFQRDIDLARRLRIGGSDYGQDGTLNVRTFDNTNKFTVDANGSSVNLDNYTTLRFGTANNNDVARLYVDDNLVLEGNNGIQLSSFNGNNLNLYAYDGGNINIESTNGGQINLNSHIDANSQWMLINEVDVNHIRPKADGDDININNWNETAYIHINDNGTIDLSVNDTFNVNGVAHFTNDVTIDGNLNVNGTLNAVNRTEINIEDNTIRLNTGFTGTPSLDAGIIVERGTANDTAIIWNETNDQWTLSNDGSNYYAIARKYVEVIGDASNTAFDVIHNLGTRDVTVMVRENNAEYNVVETDIRMKDNNTVTIAFTDAPASNAYKVIIVG